MTPCMNVYRAKIQSDGTLDKLKLRIVVRGYMKKVTSWRHLVTKSFHEDFEILLVR